MSLVTADTPRPATAASLFSALMQVLSDWSKPASAADRDPHKTQTWPASVEAATQLHIQTLGGGVPR